MLASVYGENGKAVTWIEMTNKLAHLKSIVCHLNSKIQDSQVILDDKLQIFYEKLKYKDMWTTVPWREI